MINKEEEKLESGENGRVELDAMELLLDTTSRKNITEILTLNTRKGKPSLRIKIRAIGGEEYKDIQEQCTDRYRDRKSGNMRSEFDGRKSQRLVIMTCVLEPNLKDDRLLKAYDVSSASPEDVVDKAFLPGETDYIAESILELSGYNEEVLAKVKA